MSEVFGDIALSSSSFLEDEEDGLGQRQAVLMMYTSCSLTDSAMRTIDSPDSLRVTVALLNGRPRRRATP